MESISDAELVELFLQYMGLLSLEFQYWLSVTFAVIVAEFVAGERLTRSTRLWVAILYLCVSFVFAGRFWTFVIQATELNAEILVRGFMESTESGTFVGVSRAVVFALGVGTTIWFLFFSRPTGQSAQL